MKICTHATYHQDFSSDNIDLSGVTNIEALVTNIEHVMLIDLLTIKTPNVYNSLNSSPTFYVTNIMNLKIVNFKNSQYLSILK